MIEIDIPDFNALRLEHLVLDYNGTLACDGKMIPGTVERLNRLTEQLDIHILTADTFGSVKEQLAGVSCKLSITPAEFQAIAKMNYVNRLGPASTVCIGNGRIDRLMFKKAALSIAVIQTEGAATEAMLAADIISTDINAALDLLTNPLRLKATLRS